MIYICHMTWGSGVGVAHLDRTNRFTRKLFISSIYCLIYDIVIYTGGVPLRSTLPQHLLHGFPLSGDSTLLFLSQQTSTGKTLFIPKAVLYQKNPNFCNGFY